VLVLVMVLCYQHEMKSVLMLRFCWPIVVGNAPDLGN
jgi:hypothetical protein